LDLWEGQLATYWNRLFVRYRPVDRLFDFYNFLLGHLNDALNWDFMDLDSGDASHNFLHLWHFHELVLVTHFHNWNIPRFLSNLNPWYFSRDSLYFKARNFLNNLLNLWHFNDAVNNLGLRDFHNLLNNFLHDLGILDNTLVNFWLKFHFLPRWLLVGNRWGRCLDNLWHDYWLLHNLHRLLHYWLLHYSLLNRHRLHHSLLDRHRLHHSLLDRHRLHC
jgi:hypothetical protein